MTTIDNQIRDYISQPERSVSRVEIEERLAAIEQQSVDGFTDEEFAIADQIFNALDGANPNIDPFSPDYAGDYLYYESEFTEAFYSDVIEAPETYLPDKQRYAGYSCSRFHGFHTFLKERGFAFPLTDTRADTLYRQKVSEMTAVIGRLLQSALGYAGDKIIIGDNLCEATRSGGETPSTSQGDATSLDFHPPLEMDNKKTLELLNMTIINDLVDLNGLINKVRDFQNQILSHACESENGCLVTYEDYRVVSSQIEAGWRNICELRADFDQLWSDQLQELSDEFRGLLESSMTDVEDMQSDIIQNYSDYLDDDIRLGPELEDMKSEEAEKTQEPFSIDPDSIQIDVLKEVTKGIK
jgi:hypothetical protein